jgi:signal-transduction protein with cAMP-binding, CBS, and nucleotidyltransferase domain
VPSWSLFLPKAMMRTYDGGTSLAEEGAMLSHEFEDAYEDERQIRGAILSDKIRTLQRRPAIIVAPETTVREAAGLMGQAHVGCVLVCVDGKLCGIFTERDLLNRVVASDLSPQITRVGQVMTADPDALRLGDGIAFALNLMSVGGYRNIPIVDEERRPICVVAMKQIVEFIVDLFPEGVLNLPPDPEHSIPSTIDGG